jgi:hypothetical protein
MVNTGLGNDQGSAMHAVSSLERGAIEPPAYQAVVLVEYTGKATRAGGGVPLKPLAGERSCRSLFGADSGIVEQNDEFAGDIVPAGGPRRIKGLPGRDLREVGGLSLVGYKAKAARQSRSARI